MLDGRQYTTKHGERSININASNVCRLCRCNNGNFDLCDTIRCPYVRDNNNNNSRPCTVRGRTIRHGQTAKYDCNQCICRDGSLRCTERDCSDDEDDDNDDMDRNNTFAGCRRMPSSPVCSIANLRTYPNKCTAIAAGFEELRPGPCTRDVCNVNTHKYIHV